MNDTDVYYVGDPESLNFLAFYHSKGVIKRVFGSNRPQDINIFQEAFKLGIMPDIYDVQSYGFKIGDRIKKIIRVRGALSRPFLIDF